jgi:hypothetical protein
MLILLKINYTTDRNKIHEGNGPRGSSALVQVRYDGKGSNSKVGYILQNTAHKTPDI